MAWLAVNKQPVPLDFNHGEVEVIFQFKPIRDLWGRWISHDGLLNRTFLPKGSIKKLIERELTWEDEPVYI